MKVTLWQQFSSNHSSHFHIVGVFDTAEAAQKAADEIKQILKQIEDWHTQNPEKSDALIERWVNSGEYPQAVSEIEKAFAQKYHVRWDNGIEWFWDAQVDIILNHIIHIKTIHHTDSGPEPFDEIIERLGGHGFVAGYDFGGNPFGIINVFVSCNAPNEETVDKIAMSYTNQEDDIADLKIRKNSLHFSWDFYQSSWQLDKLIQELKDFGCTNISYSFHATRDTYTGSYKVADKNEGEKS